jgi:hypothetical protein
MRGAIFNLDEDMEAANNAECSKQREICCPGKFVQPPPLECPSKTGENIKYVLTYVMVVWVVEFSSGRYKIERFLPKNQHTQRKLFNFENWCNV